MKNWCEQIKDKTNINVSNILEIGSRDADDANIVKELFSLKSEDVYVVEPNPAQQIIISEKYPDINLFKEAIFNKEGNLRFNAVNHNNKDHVGISSLLDRTDNLYWRLDTKVILVPTIKGSKLMEIINKDIDMCKIDVEGATYEVLESFGDSISRIKSFHIEAEHKVVWKKQKLYSIIESFLTEHGFEKIYFKYVNDVVVQSDSIWVQKKYVI